MHSRSSGREVCGMSRVSATKLYARVGGWLLQSKLGNNSTDLVVCVPRASHSRIQNRRITFGAGDLDANL